MNPGLWFSEYWWSAFWCKRLRDIQRWTRHRLFPHGASRLKARRGNWTVIIFILGHKMKRKGQFKKQEHSTRNYLRFVPLISLINFYRVFPSTGFFEDPRFLIVQAPHYQSETPAQWRPVIISLQTYQWPSNSYARISRMPFKVCTYFEVSSCRTHFTLKYTRK